MTFLYGILVTFVILFLAGGSYFYWSKKISRIKEKDKQTMQETVSLLVHDLRSPLDNIQKISELLLSSKHVLDEKKRLDYMKMIHDSASSMLVLINNISDAVKLGAGRLLFKASEGDIIQSVKDRINFFSLTIEHTELSIRSSFDSAIPERLPFDARIVSDVLNILFSNAIKFNYPGGWIHVDVFLHHKGESLNEEARKHGHTWFPIMYQEGEEGVRSIIISVTHSDPGIPRETVPLLFKKHEQAGTAFLEKVKQAHGISLFVAQYLVRIHGGTMGAGSEEGKGSTFYFGIPLS